MLWDLRWLLCHIGLSCRWEDSDGVLEIEDFYRKSSAGIQDSKNKSKSRLLKDLPSSSEAGDVLS